MPLKEPSSASFKRHYTDVQKNAILDAHCRLGMSQRAITRHCHAGTLPDPSRPGEPCPSFDISRGTVALYISKGADDYRAHLLAHNDALADAAIARIQGRTIQALEAKLQEYEDLQRHGEPPTVNQWKELASAATAARRLVRPAKQTQNPRTGREQAQEAEKPKTPEILTRMGVDTGKRRSQ